MDTALVIIIIQAALMFALIVLSALCSSAEMALFSLSRARVLSYADSKSPAERRINFLMKDYHRTLITIILCNMFANSLVSMLNDGIISSLKFSPAATTAVSAFTGIVILLLFGEITPMTAAYIYSAGWSHKVATPVFRIRNLLSPLTFSVEKVCDRFLDMLGRKQETGLLPEEYISFIDASRENGALSRYEAELMKETFSLRRKSVGSVLRGRVFTEFIRADAAPGEAAKTIRGSRQAYLPVTKGDSLDTAEYVLSTRAFFMLPATERGAWFERLCANRKTLFIPVGTTLEKALRVMKRADRNAALAADEYGATCGPITLQDIYSELTGKSVELDESAEREPVRIRDGLWLVDGLSAFETIRRLPGFEPVIRSSPNASGEEEPGAKTVNGVFCELLGAIPKTGDSVSFGTIRMTAKSVSGNRVSRVLMEAGTSPSPAPENTRDAGNAGNAGSAGKESGTC